ncbi:MAG: UDP-glucose 4-epimerase GalE [Nanoarchaeota archaeon]|nr:UDP-glucose 4-epimerase GalE [Nanoarchaeota archaeon]
MVKNILVAGGAGYIGSICVKRLVEEGYGVFVVDNLSKGKKDLVDSKAELFVGDINNYDFLNDVFSKVKFDAVIHFAALKDAGESMFEPVKYSDNAISTINILKAMTQFGVKKIIFSSSAAVYGESEKDVISEEDECNPVNFYGFTKLEGERFMEWYRKLGKLDYVALRYFNVAGDGGLNYIDPNAKNIFPIIGEAVAGIRDKVSVFGDDYDTRDGTCIRDYIHVVDLVEAHLLALELEGSHKINLGTSNGYTVKELIDAFSKVSGIQVPYEVVGRRKGDPACLLASCTKAKELMGWEAKLGLDEMVRSTVDAYKK